MNTSTAWECEELAALVCGLSEDDIGTDAIEEKLYDKFGVDLDEFSKIVIALIPFTAPMETFMGGKYRGFIDPVEQCFVVKLPYEKS
jgi:hypothetical protein